MDIKRGLLVSMLGLLPSILMAETATRTHLKCYLQLEDDSKIVHHFVNPGEQREAYINSLNTRSVFMSDGVTKQKISTVYECVDIKGHFTNQEAVNVEKNTLF